jgi:hemerythrin-like domain-containing protein
MPSCHDHLPPVDLDRVSATSILSGEHRVILQLLAAMEVMAGRSAAGDLPANDARDALEVLRTFADTCHHGKEETILFPALEAQVPGFGPTAVMRAEHVEGRAFIRAMGEAVTAVDPTAFARAAYGYVDLLRAHIAKEDDILFRMAQEMLSPEQDAAILEAYRRIEHDDMGDGTHFRMLAIADRLAGTYGIARASDDPQIMALLTAVCGCKHSHHGAMS